jgi:hypothetical protein
MQNLGCYKVLHNISFEQWFFVWDEISGKSYFSENTLTRSASESGLEYISKNSMCTTNSTIGNGSMKAFSDLSEKWQQVESKS